MDIITNKFPNVIIIHKSDDTSFYEVPTIIHISHFTKRINYYINNNYRKINNLIQPLDPQILYLHTKGLRL